MLLIQSAGILNNRPGKNFPEDHHDSFCLEGLQIQIDRLLWSVAKLDRLYQEVAGSESREQLIDETDRLSMILQVLKKAAEDIGQMEWPEIQ
jgi:hypothetical protein